MEKTDIDEVVRKNFPDLATHSSYIKRLTQIQADIASEKAIYRNKIKPHLEDRQEVFKEARLNGVDTKALKQLKLVLDFMDKNIINVHDKIGEDAGDTATAMFEQFNLPLPDVPAGKSLVSEAERKAKEKADAEKQAKKTAAASAKKTKDEQNAKNLKAMGGKPPAAS